MKRYASNIIEKMIEMRRHGYSYPEISRSLNVSKTTALRHTRDIEILPEHLSRWLDRKCSSKLFLKNNLEIARIEAEKKVVDICDKESLLIAAMIYWCEGAKGDFSIINTDPVLISTFIKALKKSYNLSNDRFTVSLRIYEDLDKGKCLSFWSEVTGINLDENTSIKVLNGSKHGKLKYGMCRIRLKRGNLILKEISAITKLVSEYI